MSKGAFVLVALTVGYVLLLAAILYYLPTPWNWAVSGLVVIKATIFIAVIRKAQTIGAGRRVPPPPQ